MNGESIQTGIKYQKWYYLFDLECGDGLFQSMYRAENGDARTVFLMQGVLAFDMLQIAHHEGKYMKTKSGFTLIEILVVVAVVGLLAAMGTLAVSKVRNSAHQKTAESELEIIGDAVLRLARDTGKWPNGEGRGSPGSSAMSDLSASAAGLAGNDGTFPSELWKGPYYGDNTVDPWGNHYFFSPAYARDGATIVAVCSSGKNKVSGDADDVVVRLDD